MARVPLSGPKGAGRFVLVDEEDLPLVSSQNWYLKTYPQGRTSYAYNRRRVFLHKLLMPGVKEVDHENGDGLDNRRCNLRASSRQGNCANRPKFKNNTSGFNGVQWHKANKKWRAVIKHHGKTVHVGMFHDKEEAARARDERVRTIHGPFARMNFPKLGERGLDGETIA
jgi:hypothetical protein